MKIILRRKFLPLSVALIVAATVCMPAFAVPKDDLDDLLNMSSQFDKMDKQDFQAAIDRTNDCTRARDFLCSEKEFAKAAKSARSGQDKKILAAARQNITNEKARIAEEERQRTEEAHRVAEAEERQREAEERAREHDRQAESARVRVEREARAAEQRRKAERAQQEQVARADAERQRAEEARRAAEVEERQREAEERAREQERRQQQARDAAERQAAEQERARAREEREEREAERSRKARIARADAERQRDKGGNTESGGSRQGCALYLNENAGDEVGRKAAAASNARLRALNIPACVVRTSSGPSSNTSK